MAAKKSPAKKKAAAKKRAPAKRAPRKNVDKAAMKRRADLDGFKDQLNRGLTAPQREAARKLSIKELRFANNLLRLMTPAAAYLDASGPDADYTPASLATMAGRMKKRPHVAKYIDIMKQASALAVNYDREWKRQTLMEVVERGMAMEPNIPSKQMAMIRARLHRQIKWAADQIAAQMAEDGVDEVENIELNIDLDVSPNCLFDGKLVVSTINELNKMDGDHAAQQHEHTHETQAERIRRLAGKTDKADNVVPIAAAGGKS